MFPQFHIHQFFSSFLNYQIQPISHICISVSKIIIPSVSFQYSTKISPLYYTHSNFTSKDSQPVLLSFNLHKLIFSLTQQQFNSQFNSNKSKMNQLSDSGESREYAYLHKSQSFSAFEIFLSSLGSKLFEKLNFDYSNKFVRFKKCEYMQSNKVVEYFYNVFEKKSNAQIRRKWHIKDKFVLFWIVSKHCQRSFLNDFKMKLDDWEIIASIIGLSRRFVMQKWMCLLRHTTDHFQWSKLEQNTLLKYMAKSQYNSKWSELSMKIFEESQSLILRTCKDIRQRWKNYLDPSLKRSKWSKEQDKRLLKLVTSQGKKWSAISRMIPGRTENQVKNRFITLQKKKGLTFEIDDDQESLKQNPVIGELKQQQNEVDLNISQKQENEFILSRKLKFEYQGKDIISDNNTYVGSEEYFINQVLRENNYVYKELYEE